jgi:hypothetical protein
VIAGTRRTPPAIKRAGRPDSYLVASLADNPTRDKTGRFCGLERGKEMSKRALVWLELLAAGALLFASSSGNCVSTALRDAADQVDGAPQTLGDVSSMDDLGKWFENQFGGNN